MIDVLRLLALAGLLAGCGASTERPRNVLLVSIDTLRADRLGCYGYERDTSPELDAFAAESVLFEHAIAESSWTVPSHATMLTGLAPSSHGVTTPEARPGDARFLASILKGHGYHTFAITDGGWMEPDRFGSGFRDFEYGDLGLRANLEQALAFAEFLGEDTPWFGFVHTYDVHCPYTPEAPWDDRFHSPGAEWIETEDRCGNPDFNEADLTPAQARHVSDRYDGGVRQASAELGAFLEAFEASGRLEHTIVVVTSDHGEELFERGRIGHERSLHRELLEVPLILRVPGVAPRRISEGTAGLVDLVPTLLDLLALPVEGAFDGRSLAPALRGERQELPRHRLSELVWKETLFAWTGAVEQLIVDGAREPVWSEPEDVDVEPLLDALRDALAGTER